MEPEGHNRIHKCPPTVPLQYYSPIYAWVFQVVSFPQVSPPKFCIRLSSLPYVLHVPPISFFSIRSPEKCLVRVQISKLVVIYFASLSSYLVPFKPKYYPEHPILKHPQPAFLLEYDRPSFTSIQNNMQNYIFFYILIFTFLYNRLEDKRFCAES